RNRLLQFLQGFWYILIRFNPSHVADEPPLGLQRESERPDRASHQAQPNPAQIPGGVLDERVAELSSRWRFTRNRRRLFKRGTLIVPDARAARRERAPGACAAVSRAHARTSRRRGRPSRMKIQIVGRRLEQPHNGRAQGAPLHGTVLSIAITGWRVAI